MVKLIPKLIIILIILIGAVFAFFFLSKDKNQPTAANTAVSDKEPPRIVTTNPEPLDNSTISANQIIEISFNRPLENIGEFKTRIEPEFDFKVELSGDRKTAKITPAKPFDLGTTYTFFIGPETKFDGVGRWGEEKVFHFRTIKYTGI